MNLLFDIGHPAHVHLFKNFISYLKSEGHLIIVTSRKKDVTEELLEHYKIEYYSLSVPRTSKFGMFKELLRRNKQIFKLHKQYNFNASFGTSASIGFLKLKYGVPAYNFNEDDDNVVKLYSYLAYPFATKIFNPDCIYFLKWRQKRVLYPSYHEFAYLHPNNFVLDENVLCQYSLKPKKYIIIRLSALAAHHDTGMKGISNSFLSRLKEKLKEYQIIESHELKRNDFNPWDMHQILAHAKMIISDSQTMTIEGAVLGVPSVRINTFIDKSTVINQLEEKYQLAYGFYPNDESNILGVIDYLISDNEVNNIWLEKKERLLKDKTDLNDWMIKYFRDVLHH